MMDLTRDIQSLTDFKRRTNEFSQQLKETGSPLILTVNGKAEFVVQSASAYQELLERIEQMETIAGIQRGLAQMRQGKGRPIKDVFDSLMQKQSADNA